MKSPRIESVNVGRARPTAHSSVPHTGIDKRPVVGPVEVTAPGPMGVAGGGLAGDHISDLRHHGGDHQAVYAFAREDLDAWARELGRELPSGVFGENLTTLDLDVNAARIGERWQVGGTLILEVCDPRIPCRTFAGWLGEHDWVRRFTRKAAPGPYLRVIRAGSVCAGDPIAIVSRPDHDVTVALVFRAVTLEPELLPRLAVATALSPSFKEKLARRLARPTPPA